MIEIKETRKKKKKKKKKKVKFTAIIQASMFWDSAPLFLPITELHATLSRFSLQLLLDFGTIFFGQFVHWCWIEWTNSNNNNKKRILKIKETTEIRAAFSLMKKLTNLVLASYLFVGPILA